MTVFPFILRGISLIGISAQNYPTHLRRILWNKLAKEWKPDHLLELYNEITLDEVKPAIELIYRETERQNNYQILVVGSHE